MNQSLEQLQVLNALQLQSIALLQMNSIELYQYIQNLSLENPLIELKPPSESDLADRMGSERQGLYHTNRSDESGLGPLDFVGSPGGLEETLQRFLFQQIGSLRLEERERQMISFLVESLDDDGYFRDDLNGIAADFNIPLSELQSALDRIRRLNPAGVGALNLPDCLCLQLRRINAPEYMCAIAQNHLDSVARGNYQHVAKSLNVSKGDVMRAMQTIRQLNPRPGDGFQKQHHIALIRPDVFVTKSGEEWVAVIREKDAIPFKVNQYYLSILKTTTDASVKAYLAEKNKQVEAVKYTVAQRKKTLLRCAKAIVSRQQDFFERGTGYLKPYTMSEAAEELGVHVSTVSRTARQKYLQCTYGTYPLSFFFSSSQPAGRENARGSSVIKRMLLEIVQNEDKAAPLSDQAISEVLAKDGTAISRRTVAKYRESLGIPGRYARTK